MKRWLTWSSAGEGMFNGAMQALGGIGIYALAIWLILKSGWASAAIKDALVVKLAGVSIATGGGGAPR